MLEKCSAISYPVKVPFTKNKGWNILQVFLLTDIFFSVSRLPSFSLR